MISRKVRFPKPPPPGTLMAMYPRTAVSPIMPRIASTRPSALRTRISSNRAPIAYAATHLLASASPRSNPTTGMPSQNASRPRHHPVQMAAKTVYAATMNNPT